MERQGETQTRGRPRNPEADRAILRETLRLLATTGYGAMTIEGVAAGAGVGKATIYRRFKSKRVLVAAALATLGKDAPELSDSGDIQEDLLTALHGHIRYIEDVHGLAILGGLLAQSTEHPELIALFREHVVMPRRAILTGLLRRAVERDELRGDIDLEAVVDSVVGSMFARRISGLATTEGWVRDVVRVALEGMHRQ